MGGETGRIFTVLTRNKKSKSYEVQHGVPLFRIFQCIKDRSSILNHLHGLIRYLTIHGDEHCMIVSALSSLLYLSYSVYHSTHHSHVKSISFLIFQEPHDGP